MSLKRAQSFRLDVMRNKVRMLYAPVEIVRGCNLERWDTYFRSSMRILFMLPILSFFEDFSASLDVEVSVLKISIFLPTESQKTSVISVK
jgi:hypothetical protein